MKKLSWLLCLMTMLIIVPVSSAFAESTVSYDSDASVGFYGEYVYPEKPSEGGESGGTGSSIGGSESDANSGTTSENRKPTLPQTGDSTSSQVTLIGMLFISFAFLLIYKRKQKTTIYSN